MPRHGLPERNHSTPQSTVRSAGGSRSHVQILRLNITANGDTAHTANVRSARRSSICRLAQRHIGYRPSAFVNAIKAVTAMGSRVGAHAAPTIQVKSGAFTTPFELSMPCVGHGALDDHG